MNPPGFERINLDDLRIKSGSKRKPFKFQGAAIVRFGKHSGTPITDLPHDYIDWLLKMRREPDSWVGNWAKDHEDQLYKVLTTITPDSVPEYKLADDQRLAADDIVFAFLNEDARVYRLQGGAGYGKSFAAIDVVIRMKAAGFIVRACAPSYVAAQNLGKDLEPLGVPCATIARTIGLGVVWNKDDDEYVVTDDTLKKVDSLFTSRSLLIVDEYSMVGNDVGKLLYNTAIANNSRLLVIGDSYQLPCPKQDEDSFLCSVEPHSTLTIPKRYPPDSDLFRVEQGARDNPWEFDAQDYDDDVSMEVMKVNTEAELYTRFVEYYQMFSDQTTLMLWYRRKDMTNANKIIRKELFGDDAAQIVSGERLRVQRTSDYLPDSTLEPPPSPDEGVKTERFYSGTALRVAATYKGSRSYYFKPTDKTFIIPTIWVQRENDNRWISTIFSITENEMDPDSFGGKEYNEVLKYIKEWSKNNNSWGFFREFKSQFLQVAYHYASTIHRVQGMSVDNVFIDPAALRCSDPYQARKLQYVGFTRAKQRLVSL